MANPTVIPQYNQNPDYGEQQFYQELLNRELTFWFSNRNFISGVLTAADIDAMYTTPVILLPAPLTGFMYVVELLTLQLVFGSSSFANGGDVYLQYGTTGHSTNYATPNANIPAAIFTGLSANIAISTPGTINTTNGIVTSIAGAAPISITNATQAFTSGAGCSVNWYLNYSIYTIT